MSNWTEEDYTAHLARIRGGTHPLDMAGTPTLPPTPRKHKYGVAPKAERTVGVLTFASKAEAQAYQKLLLLLEKGEITELELQPVFKFPPGYKYVSDFRVTYKDGSVSVVDVKGVLTPVFRLKMRDMAYWYPEVKVELWGVAECNS